MTLALLVDNSTLNTLVGVTVWNETMDGLLHNSLRRLHLRCNPQLRSVEWKQLRANPQFATEIAPEVTEREHR